MIPDYPNPFDRYADLFWCPLRQWPKISKEERLRRWHKRVTERNPESKRPLTCKLTKRIKEDLGLQDQSVRLEKDGTLVHVTSGNVIEISPK